MAITAAIILWYTMETMRLRREAEARAKHDREPSIDFIVEQLSTLFEPSDHEHRWRFNVVNHSPNSALALVRIRLKLGPQDAVHLSNPAYNGTQIWEITPFFQMSGWFDLQEILTRADQAPGDGALAGGEILLNVQVDLYWPDRRHFATLKKEYRIRLLPPQNIVVEFWPEVTTSFTPLGYPEKLP